MLQYDYVKLINNPRLAKFSLILSGLLLIYTLTSQIHNLWPPQATALPNISKQIQKSANLAIPDIAQWHLFGISNLPTDSGNMRITQLQLKLVGILAGNSSNTAQAIIAEPGEEARVYNIGDVVPGGATLSQVLADGVILSHNNQLEKLPLTMYDEDKAS